jgi:predicted Zn-dependent protease
MLPGTENRPTLLTMMGKGILIEELEWCAGPNPISGTIALRAPWAYLVESGTIKGRLEGVVLSGNVFEALRELGGVGNDAAWIGETDRQSSPAAEGRVAISRLDRFASLAMTTPHLSPLTSHAVRRGPPRSSSPSSSARTRR